LRRSDNIRHAIKNYAELLGIKDGASSTPIAVARLADGAGINQVFGVGNHGQLAGFEILLGAISWAQRLPLVLMGAKASLNMCVSEERHSGIGGTERLVGVAYDNDVLVFIQRRAVATLHFATIFSLTRRPYGLEFYVNLW